MTVSADGETLATTKPVTKTFTLTGKPIDYLFKMYANEEDGTYIGYADVFRIYKYYR